MSQSDNDETLTVYEPNQWRGGLIWSLRQARQDLIASRYVIARLFWRDFIAQFRQKVLGYFWALLSPLLGIAAFLFLFSIGVLKPGEGEIPYILYVLVGSTVWACLPGAMGAVSSGLQVQADLIMRTRIPKLALAMSSLAGVFYGIAISMGTMAIVFLITGRTPTLWFLAYPILVLPMVLLGTAIGLMLAVLGTIARDLTPLATQALALLMYLTPAIYLQSSIQNPVIQTLVKWNPLTYLVEVPRSLICLNHAEGIPIFLLVVAGTLILVAIGLRIFYQLEDLVAERL
ncbi:ABC transporter permease [Bradyrhizobium liaoningense]|uniref:ABC transporter permease n=1 Tax=Bradyrhizobium liaoningense TaxID=43992 RepID=UPI001BA6A923|nr:ABC transporter permease [Bradyrhizobium liaoningense]MBR0843861.1 ABC transporter permease [Bradyrhizobium liaoningense]